MFEPAFDVAHFTNLDRQVTVEIDTAVIYSAIDQSVLRASAAGRYQKRPEFFVVNVTPALFALDHMRIGIDSCHAKPPENRKI